MDFYFEKMKSGFGKIHKNATKTSKGAMALARTALDIG